MCGAVPLADGVSHHNPHEDPLAPFPQALPGWRTGDYGFGRGRLHVGHSILTSIQRCKHWLWKKWLQGVTMRARGRPTSAGFMQITHSTPARQITELNVTHLPTAPTSRTLWLTDFARQSSYGSAGCDNKSCARLAQMCWSCADYAHSSCKKPSGCPLHCVSQCTK